MKNESNESQHMTTPFETTVMESLVQVLRKASVATELVEIIDASYRAEKLPSAESLLESIKQNSGDKGA